MSNRGRNFPNYLPNAWVMSAFKIEQTANTDIEAIPEAIRDLFR